MIVDDVLEDSPPWVESLLTLFEGLEVTFVGVHGPPAEFGRRGKVRGNRRPGQARAQVEQVHSVALYDAEVNTSVLRPEGRAVEILCYLQVQHDTSAFDRLRETDSSWSSTAGA